nr:zinc finger, CCHC-type [Tanacetum cinerariifolium]
MAPYTPQHNRVAERKNRTLKEMVNSMLSYFGLSERFCESRDVIFDEERFTSIPRPRGMIQPSLSKIAKDEVEGIDDGIDLFDTYAPVARISTTRLLLALAATHDLVIHQMDVITTLLNGYLDEEIYIKQREGFVILDMKASKKTLVSQLEYFRAIGCLMYAMISTRPDIAFAVGKLSSGYPSVIEGYSDASWINNMEDHSSTSS